MTRLLPIKHVAQLTGLHWHTVKNIDYRRLLRERTEPQRHTLRRLVMDEFALFKGHRYATVVMDADTQQVLWVGEGRSRAAFRPFFVWLGAEGCAAIQSVAMDMNTALDLEVRHHCPQAEVVYDLFHVVAKYGREVIDRVASTRPINSVITQNRVRSSNAAAGCCCATRKPARRA